MKKYIILSFLFFVVINLSAQDKSTYIFAKRDTTNMYLDIYMPKSEPTACIVYAFGGGFMTGSRDDKDLLPYLQLLQEKGFMVVSFDYRLGLKDKKINSLSVKPVEYAIKLAVEDLYAATRYLIDNQEKLKVDTSKIILIGSSAGAITALQADYMLARRMPISEILPTSFKFAGVVSFAGGVFSREGKVNYLRNPAPTFFLHGTADKLVPYKKIQIFNIGIFGDNSLIKRFKKFNYPFIAHRYEDYGHEIATIMIKEIDATMDFINNMVLLRQYKQVDSYINDTTIQKEDWGSTKPSKLHKMVD